MMNNAEHIHPSFFKQKLRHEAYIILAVTLAFAILTYSSRYLTSLAPQYLDEEVYIKCGIKYINGLPPVLCNFEHPPLGKYVIGLFVSANAGLLLPILNYFLSLSILYKIIYVLIANKKTTLYAVLLIGFDTSFMYTYMHLLLDPIAFTFLLVAIYLCIITVKNVKRKSPSEYKDMVFLSIFLGLALATKWQTAYSLLGILIIIVWTYFKYFNLKLSFSKIIKLAIILTLVYSSTFVMDLTLGMMEPIDHNIMALTYMSYRHGLSPPLAVIGVIKLLSRIEVWRLAPFVIMYVTTTSVAPNTTSLVLLNSTFVEPHARVFTRIGVGVPSVLWPILFPIYLLVIKARLERGRFRELDPLIIIVSTSLLNLLNGPLDWYYVYVVPFLYAIAVPYILSHRRGRYIATALLLVQLIQYLLFFSGMIPYAEDMSI